MRRNGHKNRSAHTLTALHAACNLSPKLQPMMRSPVVGLALILTRSCMSRRRPCSDHACLAPPCPCPCSDASCCCCCCCCCHPQALVLRRHVSKERGGQRDTVVAAGEPGSGREDLVRSRSRGAIPSCQSCPSFSHFAHLVSTLSHRQVTNGAIPTPAHTNHRYHMDMSIW